MIFWLKENVFNDPSYNLNDTYEQPLDFWVLVAYF